MSKLSTTSARPGSTLLPIRWQEGLRLLLPYQQLCRCQGIDRGDRAAFLPPPPWWALNRYGLCQLYLGFPDSALDAFKRALPVAPTKEDEGTMLNNLSQIY